MSIEFTFKKDLTIRSIEENTSIQSENRNDDWYLVKDGGVIHVYLNEYEEEFINSLIKKGYKKETDEGGVYLILEDDKFYIEPVSEKDHLIDMISYRGSGADIIDEIVLKFQTTFITDNEYYELSSRSFDDVARETTIKNGYDIDENGLISRKDVEEDI